MTLLKINIDSLLFVKNTTLLTSVNRLKKLIGNHCLYVYLPIQIELSDRDGLNYCHQSDANTPLGGLKIPIEAQPIYTANGITAILVTTHEEETVILLGSKRGHLTKVTCFFKKSTVNFTVTFT